MNAKKFLALGVLSMMVMSGCLGVVDEEFVLSKLPEDWTVKTERIKNERRKSTSADSKEDI